MSTLIPVSQSISRARSVVCEPNSSPLSRRPAPEFWLCLLAAVVTGVLAGCGRADKPAANREPVEGGDVTTTAASLAWVTAEHLGKPASASAENDISEAALGTGSVGAKLQYRNSAGEDGDRVTVAIGKRTLDELNCPDTGDRSAAVGCVKTARGTVLWARYTPEEDPGNVAVGVRKGAVTVLVYQSGPKITGDPRELDLPVSVGDMFTLAEDPRIDVTTSKDAVNAGASLPYWTP